MFDHILINSTINIVDLLALRRTSGCLRSAVDEFLVRVWAPEGFSAYAYPALAMALHVNYTLGLHGGPRTQQHQQYVDSLAAVEPSYFLQRLIDLIPSLPQRLFSMDVSTRDSEFDTTLSGALVQHLTSASFASRLQRLQLGLPLLPGDAAALLQALPALDTAALQLDSDGLSLHPWPPQPLPLQLTAFTVRGTAVDIAAIAAARHLRSLELDCWHISNEQALTTLTALRVLHVEDVWVDNMWATVLQQLPLLEELWLESLDIELEQAARPMALTGLWVKHELYMGSHPELVPVLLPAALPHIRQLASGRWYCDTAADTDACLAVLRHLSSLQHLELNVVCYAPWQAGALCSSTGLSSLSLSTMQDGVPGTVGYTEPQQHRQVVLADVAGCAGLQQLSLDLGTAVGLWDLAVLAAGACTQLTRLQLVNSCARVSDLATLLHSSLPLRELWVQEDAGHGGHVLTDAVMLALLFGSDQGVISELGVSHRSAFPQEWGPGWDDGSTVLRYLRAVADGADAGAAGCCKVR